MATSGSYNIKNTRDDIIEKAYQIVQTVGMGETPDTQAITDAAAHLNDIIASFAADGMPIWSIKQAQFSLTEGVASYSVGVGATWDIPAPQRILQAWIRNNLLTYPTDTPIQVITREEYNRLTPKTTKGWVNQIWYDQNPVRSATEAASTAYVWMTPNSYVATNCTLGLSYQRPVQDFDASTDNPDFPPEWIRALTWTLASDIAYMEGLPFAERSMIEKKADKIHAMALLSGSQEGSLYLQPETRWYQPWSGR
jgi:hypothetical protein